MGGEGGQSSFTLERTIFRMKKDRDFFRERSTFTSVEKGVTTLPKKRGCGVRSISEEKVFLKKMRKKSTHCAIAGSERPSLSAEGEVGHIGNAMGKNSVWYSPACERREESSQPVADTGRGKGARYGSSLKRKKKDSDRVTQIGGRKGGCAQGNVILFSSGKEFPA